MRIAGAVAVLTILGSALIHGQGVPATNQASTTLGYPVRRASGPIRIDGRLNERAWANAVEVAGFTVSGSAKLAPVQTVMRLLYDDKNLYLGVKCVEPHLSALVTKVHVHDGPVWRDDCVEFFIDANHDHATYWHFIVNSAGVRYEAFKLDSTWTVPWEAATSKGPNAWYVEAAIPFASLGVAPPRPWEIWGFNLDRERRAGGPTQLYNWADVHGVFNSPSLFGHLIFAEGKGAASRFPVAAMARAMGGNEARIYRDGGCWIVKAGSPPRSWSYQELLRRQQGNVAHYWRELTRIYARHPGLPGKALFEKYRERYDQARALAAARGTVDPEACAAAKVFLDSLEGSLHDLYWQARVDVLNASF